MHLEVYRQRPDVGAVVHAHPATATGFAVAGVPLNRAVLAEVITTLGGIPIADYATPSTAELPAAIRDYIKAHDGLLLANHGALAVARRSVRRLLPDGDDRAFRQDQPGGADAGPREPAVARRGRHACRACAGCTASARRRRSAPSDAASRRAAARWWHAPVADDAAGTRHADAAGRPRRARRHERRDSANIRPADGAHRWSGPQRSIGSGSRSPRPGQPGGDMEWAKRSAWSRRRAWSR